MAFDDIEEPFRSVSRCVGSILLYHGVLVLTDLGMYALQLIRKLVHIFITLSPILVELTARYHHSARLYSIFTPQQTKAYI